MVYEKEVVEEGESASPAENTPAPAPAPPPPAEAENTPAFSSKSATASSRRASFGK